ncbi:MAG: hypothetical protein ACYDBB_05830 [Armatimonadota bacterium]
MTFIRWSLACILLILTTATFAAEDPSIAWLMKNCPELVDGGRNQQTFASWSNACYLLKDAVDVGPVILGKSVLGEVFLRDGVPVLLCWVDIGSILGDFTCKLPTTVTIDLGRQAKLYAWDTLTHSLRGKSADVEVGTTPIFIRGVADRYVAEAVSNTVQTLLATAGDDAPLLADEIGRLVSEGDRQALIQHQDTMVKQWTAKRYRGAAEELTRLGATFDRTLDDLAQLPQPTSADEYEAACAVVDKATPARQACPITRIQPDELDRCASIMAAGPASAKVVATIAQQKSERFTLARRLLAARLRIAEISAVLAEWQHTARPPKPLSDLSRMSLYQSFTSLLAAAEPAGKLRGSPVTAGLAREALADLTRCDGRVITREYARLAIWQRHLSKLPALEPVAATRLRVTAKLVKTVAGAQLQVNMQNASTETANGTLTLGLTELVMLTFQAAPGATVRLDVPVPEARLLKGKGLVVIPTGMLADGTPISLPLEWSMIME